MGVEPTWDRLTAPPGFEDRSPHRGTPLFRSARGNAGPPPQVGAVPGILAAADCNPEIAAGKAYWPRLRLPPGLPCGRISPAFSALQGASRRPSTTSVRGAVPATCSSPWKLY